MDVVETDVDLHRIKWLNRAHVLLLRGTRRSGSHISPDGSGEVVRRWSRSSVSTGCLSPVRREGVRVAGVGSCRGTCRR